jgi:hypothetical protein
MLRMLRATLAALVGALLSWAAVAFVFSLFGAYDHEQVAPAMIVMVIALSLGVGFVYSRWFWVTEPEL